MDFSLLIGIASTLIVSGLSIWGTYLVQTKVSEREKKWAREANDRKRTQEIEDEQRRIKRESISNRLNIIEEAATIMMFLTGLALTDEFGDPVYSDKMVIQDKRKRLEEISGQAWTCVRAVDSERLQDSYLAISSAYEQTEREGRVDTDEWNKAYASFPALVKIIDDIKANA